MLCGPYIFMNDTPCIDLFHLPLHRFFINSKRTGGRGRLMSGSTAAPDTFRQHVWDARLGGGFDVCAPCLNAVCHPGWRMLFLQAAVNFLQTDLLSAHRIWPRNSNSLKRVKGSDPRASACSFFPSINGEKWRGDRMLFSFFASFEELHKLSGAAPFFNGLGSVGSYVTWPNPVKFFNFRSRSDYLLRPSGGVEMSISHIVNPITAWPVRSSKAPKLYLEKVWNNTYTLKRSLGIKSCVLSDFRCGKKEELKQWRKS